jgi:curved DNA-binding protein CbpA
MTGTPDDSPRDPYAVLGVSRGDSREQIARAYRALVREHHPDTCAGGPSDPARDQALRDIVAAYAVLRDRRRRAAYDRQHPAPRPDRHAVRHYRDPPVVIGNFRRDR